MNKKALTISIITVALTALFVSSLFFGIIYKKVEGIQSVYDQIEPTFKAAGDTQSSKKIASVEIDTSSSTWGYILNDSGRDRVISRTFHFVELLNDTGGTGPWDLEIATSADQYWGGIAGDNNPIFNGTFPTTTPSLHSSSTADRAGINGSTSPIWLADSYLVFRVSSGTDSDIVTTTANGIVGVEYWVND